LIFPLVGLQLAVDSSFHQCLFDDISWFTAHAEGALGLFVRLTKALPSPSLVIFTDETSRCVLIRTFLKHPSNRIDDAARALFVLLYSSGGRRVSTVEFPFFFGPGGCFPVVIKSPIGQRQIPSRRTPLARSVREALSNPPGFRVNFQKDPVPPARLAIGSCSLWKLQPTSVRTTIIARPTRLLNFLNSFFTEIPPGAPSPFCRSRRLNIEHSNHVLSLLVPMPASVS